MDRWWRLAEMWNRGFGYLADRSVDRAFDRSWKIWLYGVLYGAVDKGADKR